MNLIKSIDEVALQNMLLNENSQYCDTEQKLQIETTVYRRMVHVFLLSYSLQPLLFLKT